MLDGRRFCAVFLALLIAGSFALSPGQEPKPEQAVRVMVVTGGHPYDTTFESLFEGYKEIVAKVYPWDVAYKRDFRSNYDVLVLYNLTQEIDPVERKNLQDFVESGKGLVVLHHAIANYWKTWPWYQEVTGAKYFLITEGGTPRSVPTIGQQMSARPAGGHPITAGIGPMHWEDEAYKGMVISPAVKVLLETDNAASERQIAWVSPYQKSRVVVILGGHDRKAHLYPEFRALIKNAILWSAGR
jgi:type 1 glutamine amidotransferase